jgi:uncharacterized protein YdhG (YjbR/CyaY superfamily)
LSSRSSATELEEAEQSALEVIANGEKRRMPKHRMRGMKLSVPKSVDEYIAAQPEGVGRKLEQVRAAIRRAVPEADEHRLSPTDTSYMESQCCISPDSRNTIRSFAASATFFATLKDEDELSGYKLRKGRVQFQLTKPAPVKLISRIAKLRAAGISATAKKPLLGRGNRRRKPQ